MSIKTFSNTNVNLFQESVPEGYNYIVDYRNGNVKVTRDGRDITGQFEFWPIYDLYLERYRVDSYDSYEYSDGYESFVESYGWQNLELRMAFSEKIVPTESPWSMFTVIQERFWEQAGTLSARCMFFWPPFSRFYSWLSYAPFRLRFCNCSL